MNSELEKLASAFPNTVRFAKVNGAHTQNQELFSRQRIKVRSTRQQRDHRCLLLGQGALAVPVMAHKHELSDAPYPARVPQALPTFRLYLNGACVDEITGARPVQLRQLLTHYSHLAQMRA